MSSVKGMSSVKYAVTTIVVVCAVILVVLTVMGPKIGLQTAPIEPKAAEYIARMHYLNPGEKLTAYKATSYYSYSSGIVVTDKRIFAFHHDKLITSIPLDKISMVMIKDSELGHQEVLISAQADGVIGIDLHHSDVAKFVNLLHVSANIIKHFSKHDIQEAVKNPPMIKTTTSPAR